MTPELAERPRISRGLPRDHVAEIQRTRIVAAAVDVIGEIGYARLTVAAVICRARVSRKTFYDVFADREDCFLASLELTIARATTIAVDAYSREASWCEGMRSALSSLLALIDDEPVLARLWVIEASWAGRRVSQRRAEVLATLAEAIDGGRTTADTQRQPPEITGHGVVGSILAVLHTRISTLAEEPTQDLLGPLMYLVVLPYLGSSAASRELIKPTPRVARVGQAGTPPRRRDPLDGLNMRLTHRTLMVLAAIEQNPGASNREIAELAEITDQGQISKLLSRLAGRTLIENHGHGQIKGAANAWYLTARGSKVMQAIRPRGLLR